MHSHPPRCWPTSRTPVFFSLLFPVYLQQVLSILDTNRRRSSETSLQREQFSLPVAPKKISRDDVADKVICVLTSLLASPASLSSLLATLQPHSPCPTPCQTHMRCSVQLTGLTLTSHLPNSSLLRGRLGSFLFLFTCVCVKLLQSLCEPMDCSLPGSSVHGILQARTLEWVAMPSSRGSSWYKYQTCVPCISCIGRWVLYHECGLGSPFLFTWFFLLYIFVWQYIFKINSLYMFVCLAALGLSCVVWDVSLWFSDCLWFCVRVIAPWHVGSLFLHQGLNPCPLHCKADS